jgi:hypothetical protein
LFKWRIDLLSDHSIGQYAGHIATAVHEENSNLATNGDVADAEDLVIQSSGAEPLCDEAR